MNILKVLRFVKIGLHLFEYCYCVNKIIPNEQCDSGLSKKIKYYSQVITLINKAKVPQQFQFCFDEFDFRIRCLYKMDAVVPIHSEFKGAYVSRSSRCSYLVICLCGDGTLLPPMCICENEEIKRGLELLNEQEVLYKGNSRMNCSTDLLNEYINEIFLPELIKRKEHMKYE